MNLLITGGAGFIGSNFIRYMLDRYPQYQLVNVDLLTYAGNLENLKEIDKNERYTFIQGDIRDREEMERIVCTHHIDVIINFAAESHVDRSIDDPDVFLKTNVFGTQALLDVSLSQDIEKYVQVSTDEVYGSLDMDGYFTEKTPIKPNSPYSASKASADLIVRSYHKTYDLNVNITRCSNNYGPYQFPEKLIPLMVTNALYHEPLPVYGDGLNVRDWLHVKDHCSALDLVIHKGESGEVYNIGGNNEKTNLDIVKTILSELDRDESLIHFVKDRLGHDKRYAIDNTKISNQLSWKPEYTLENGLKETIQWYVNNKQWWKNIKDGSYQDYYKKQYAQRLGVSL